jgi:hypothetical protein
VQCWSVYNTLYTWHIYINNNISSYIILVSSYMYILYTQLYQRLLYCTVLYCTALYCTVLVLHCTALYCTVLYCTALNCTTLHCTTALYCTVMLLRAQLLHELICRQLAQLHGRLGTRASDKLLVHIRGVIVLRVHDLHTPV